MTRETSLEPRLVALLDAAPDDADAFRALCREVDDWDALFDFARSHEMQGVLYHYARQAGVEIPGDVEKHVRREVFFVGALQSAFRSNLYELAGALADDGIVAVALKGPALAERFYPEPSLRSGSDIDLLVTPDRFDQSIEVARRLGYLLSDTEARSRYHRKFHYHLVFVREGNRGLLEFHFRAMRAFGSALDAEPLLSRSVVHESADGCTVRTLSLEDEALYLVLHFAKHFVYSVKWLFDLRLLVRARPDLDWALVRSRAREHGLERAFLAGAREYNRRFTRAPIPVDGLSDSRSRAVDLLRRLGRNGDASRKALTSLTLAYEAVLADRPWSGAKLVGRGMARIARRRVYRYARPLVPEHWNG